MLQEFLNANLLPITDEGHFEKIKTTADELAKELVNNKAKVLSYTLTALDPDIPADNPNVVEVKGLITKNWSTFITNSKDTPITFIRAVMLEALQIVSNNTDYACLIWLAGRNIQQQFKLIGKEKDLIAEFLLSLGNLVEKKAVESWSLPSEARLQKLKIDITQTTITGAVIDENKLLQHLKAASGHSGNDGGENPHHSQQWNLWPTYFSQRTAKGIAEVVNKAFNEQLNSLRQNQAQIQEIVVKLLSQTQSEILDRNNFLQMRTQLLWWKETCYSTSLNQSYRHQQNGLLQILLANDYSLFVPTIYPTSADYFLKETHRALVKDEDKKMKVSEILKHIELSREVLKKVFTEPASELGRISLLNFIKGLVWNKYTSEQFKNFVGFDDSVEMTLTDFTIWLFHDFQSFKISIIR